MKIYALIILAFLTTTAIAAELETGLQAYENQDYPLALQELQPLAEQDNGQAQLILGSMYFFGNGVAQSNDEAIKWWSLAAEKNFDYAVFNLSFLYAKTHDLGKDAIKWHSLAATKGYDKAQYALGEFYYIGQGIKRDYVKALKYYRLAAKQNHPQAQFALARMYHHGQGTLQNYQQAVKYYKLAAHQGNVQAQNQLGTLYANGKAIAQNNVFAHMWLNLATAAGDENAVKARNEIAKIMTIDEIITAQNLAQQCLESHYKNCE